MVKEESNATTVRIEVTDAEAGERRERWAMPNAALDLLISLTVLLSGGKGRAEQLKWLDALYSIAGEKIRQKK